MAKHLASHGCKSAYPTKEAGKEAQLDLRSAGFAPLISLEDEEQMAQGIDPRISISQAYKAAEAAEGGDNEGKKDRKEQEGPLAFLGLQRKESVEEEENKE